MHKSKAFQERLEVVPHILNEKSTEHQAKVRVGEIWQDSNDLIVKPECGFDMAHSGVPTQVMENLQLVQDSSRAAGDIYLLESNVMFLRLAERLARVQRVGQECAFVAGQILCLVYRRECT